MKVKVIWEFDVNTEDMDAKFVDIKGLAKDLTRSEMKYLLEHMELTENDFDYIIDGDD